ncbi:carnitine dehydratase [Sulfolobus sp. A20-N-F8]|nr:carnitine dehydratase [Sulfolobus sp. A20-N-F8]
MNQFKPLSDIRVLELTVFWSGPYTGRLLAELGAEVIKIEPPWGDPQRYVPPYVNIVDEKMSLHFIFYNANKKFITLNLKTEKGRSLFLELIKKTDIFIENLKPGSLERMGLGYDTLKVVNPRLIYCSITGYGYHGPYKELPGFDPTVETESGFMDTNGFPEMPTRVGMGILDIMTPYAAVGAILAALRYRDKTGEGQRIDMAMFDMAVIASQQSMVYYLGNLPYRVGPSSSMFYPEYLYKTKDGYIYVIIHTDDAWKRLAEYFGREDLANNPNYRTNEGRLRHKEELHKIVSKWFEDLSTEEAFRIVSQAGGVAGRFRPLSSQLTDPHVRARELYKEIEIPSENKRIILPNSVFKLEKIQAEVNTVPMPRGYHNFEIFKSLLGLTDDEIKRLKQEKSI